MLDTRQKIVDADQLSPSGESTVVAIGRFDVIRAEHCRLLREARDGASRLIVVVLADSVRQTLLLDQQSRAQLAAALVPVDQVVICESAEAEQIAIRVSASSVLDVESRLQRDLVADVLQKQSARS